MDEKQQRGLYEAGAGEIVWKNFLAGFSRALGGIVVYLIFLVAAGIFLMNFVLPQVLPLFTSYTNLFKSFGPVK